jgi:hypothetical protein
MFKYDVLFVVRASSGGLSSQEIQKVNTMVGWNLTVHTIVDTASASLFNQMVAMSRCVFVGEEVAANSVNTKLVSAPIGVVFEEYALVDEFLVAPGITFGDSSTLNIVNRTHYIVSFVTPPSEGMVSLQVFHQTFLICSLNSGWATGLTVLGRHPNRSNLPALIAVRQGGTLMGGNLAAGRRVMLPWGDANQEFSNLNANGLMIMRRALEWAMGMGAD